MNTSNFDLSGIEDNLVYYLLKLINKLKFGKIKQINNDNTFIVSLDYTKDNKKIQLLTCIALENKEETKNYKVGDLVAVVFTDDYEELYIKNNQNKQENNTYKHCLSNGLIIGTFKQATKEEVKIGTTYKDDFTQYSFNDLKLKLKSDGKIGINNNQYSINQYNTDLINVLTQLVNLLMVPTLAVFNSLTQTSASPATIAAFSANVSAIKGVLQQFQAKSGLLF